MHDTNTLDPLAPVATSTPTETAFNAFAAGFNALLDVSRAEGKPWRYEFYMRHLGYLTELLQSLESQVDYEKQSRQAR